MGAAYRPGEVESAWESARAYAQHLAAGGAPRRIQVSGLILEPGEQAAFSTQATYERYYGGDGSYTTTGMFAFGSPAFVIGALAGTAIVNSRRKARAAQNAMVTWRERQEAPVIGTDRRLLVASAARGWLSFWYAGLSELYPDVGNWSTIMVWPDTAPLRLTGLASPYVAAHVAAHVMPGQWTSWPQFAPLLGLPGPQAHPSIGHD